MPSVWILNHYAGYPETVPATRTFELSRILAKEGWAVTVLACSFNHYTFVDDLGESGPPIQVQVRDGVRWVFIRARAYRENGLDRLRNMIDFSRRAIEWSRTQAAPDIIIGTSVHPFAAEAARRIARKKSSKFCYEITDLWPETLVDLESLTRRSPLYLLLRSLERAAFRSADGVIGLMPRVPEYALESHGLAIRRFAYIPNGMNPTCGRRAGSAPVAQRRRVAYAGGFARAHGLDTVIEAATILDRDHPGRFTFDLYGDGPERGRLETLARERDLDGVTFHGLIPKSALHDKLTLATACLCTGESLSVHRFGISFNKLFDYFDAARPIVFAVNSGNDPVETAGAGVSIEAGSGVALASAIRHLCSLPAEELDRMGESGRSFLLAEHTFAVLAGRLNDFLKSVGQGID